MSQPIAYTYEADTHCPECAEKRFGPECEGTDREGNAVGAIFPWDEWYDPSLDEAQTLACGTCHREIETYTPTNDDERSNGPRR